jgi:hypothetical protein
VLSNRQHEADNLVQVQSIRGTVRLADQALELDLVLDHNAGPCSRLNAD